LRAGNSPEEYAQQAGVTLNTVRTRLKSLFRKTGTRRQSGLASFTHNNKNNQASHEHPILHA
jgi:DNA-binding CsgD family transcriptional regulator